MCNYHLVWAESSNSFQKNTSHEKGVCFPRQKGIWAPAGSNAILELLWALRSFPGRVGGHQSPCLPSSPLLSCMLDGSLWECGNCLWTQPRTFSIHKLRRTDILQGIEEVSSFLSWGENRALQRQGQLSILWYLLSAIWKLIDPLILARCLVAQNKDLS